MCGFRLGILELERIVVIPSPTSDFFIYSLGVFSKHTPKFGLSIFALSHGKYHLFPLPLIFRGVMTAIGSPRKKRILSIDAMQNHSAFFLEQRVACNYGHSYRLMHKFPSGDIDIH